MFCPNCGYRNTDDVAFCQNCGTQLSSVNTQQVYQQTTANPAYQQGVYTQSLPISVGLTVLKKICSSPVALVAVIAYTAAALFSFINSINGSSGILGYIYQFASMMDMEEIIGDLYYAVRSTSIISAVIGMIPTILIAIGLWMTYASAANHQYVGMKTSGLTLIKVILIISLVFICITLAAVEIIALIAVINLADSYYGSSMVASLVGVMVGVAIAMALLILFYAKSIKSINTISMTAHTGNPSDKVSAYVAVMAFIMGGFTLLSVFSNFYIFALLSNLCSATSSITFGVFLFSYRGQMRTAMNSSGYMNIPQQPAYAVPNTNAYIPQMQNSFVQQSAYFPQSDGVEQSTTVLSNEPQQLVTCLNCGKQYMVVKGQICQCPYCGTENNEKQQ